MYTTPERMQVATELNVKKSRFIGRVVPIASVGEAETALEQLRQTEKAANHHCFAYSIGLGVPVERFSDAGEPSGTAGRPILEVMRRQGIANVLVVVTRYFGGTLLGASGLIRAYADAAAHALSETPMLTCRQMHVLTITCDYGQYGKLEYELGQSNLTLLGKQFLAEVTFQVVVSVEAVNTLCTHIGDWTGGRASVTVQPAAFVGCTQTGSFRFDVPQTNEATSH